MITRWKLPALLVLAAGLGACSTYAPVKLDEKTGQYATSTQLDPGATRVWETGVNPKEFKLVLLATQTNVYPLRFEFFARSALFDLGLKRVLNVGEMAALLEDKGLGDKVDPESIRKLSNSGLPVLVVDMRSTWDGDVRRYVTLKAIDGRNGKTLLSLDHPKLIWMDVDPEAHLPVFNALRNWYQTSSGNKT